MTLTFRPADLNNEDLEELLLEPPSATPLTGDILVRRKAMYVAGEGKLITGVWESEPGRSRWEFAERGEVIYVLSGSMTVHEDGGEPVLLTAGSAAVFPVGWAGKWEVHERLRKVMVLFADPDLGS